MKDFICKEIQMKRLFFQIFSALFTILFLIGCAQRVIYWDKEGATKEQFNKDNYTCLQQSQEQYTYYRGGTGPYNPAMGTSGSTTNPRLYVACMEAQGYEKKKQPEPLK